MCQSLCPLIPVLTVEYKLHCVNITTESFFPHTVFWAGASSRMPFPLPFSVNVCRGQLVLYEPASVCTGKLANEISDRQLVACGLNIDIQHLSNACKEK